VKAAALLAAALASAGACSGQEGRSDLRLDEGWRTVADATGSSRYDGCERPGYDDAAWKVVAVPHNWDAYEGLQGQPHTDRHGTAWYRRAVPVPAADRGRRLFLFFEGVGDYATVWLNGREVGRHAGGRTTFTLDVTAAARPGEPNLLAVRAEHPDGIRDLPWVCGGSAPLYGFSEGSQPMGIFRPVHLVATDPLRVEPFGVHVWNDADASAEAAVLHGETEIRNYDAAPRDFRLQSRLYDPAGELAAELVEPVATLAPGQATTVRQDTPALRNARLWSPSDPALYTWETELLDAAGAVLDREETRCGVRTLHWPGSGPGSDPRLLVNGRPVFVNGISEYEHNLGASHAFGDEQIRARVAQIRAAGFNAVRDAHYPHNLRYQEAWDRDGVLWWPQFAAHIWFDRPDFRANFLALLRDWVRERRNSPALMLWGIENESALPPDFTRQCAELIRRLDPTASSQRPVVVCSQGSGADWTVPQNWSGTYGGDPALYGKELAAQRLVAEYGAWRSLGYHQEGPFRPNGPLTEDRMTQLLELKVREAEAVREQVCGHFVWLLSSHENPGRKAGPHGEQLFDGSAPLDHVGPANNKGLLTLWGEPTDAYYMFRANYAPAATEPMVVIVSHSWPERWSAPGKKRGLVVYSNCEEVELFNDYRRRSLGRRRRQGVGTHFQWDDPDIESGVLYAEGYVGGKRVASDSLVLRGLPRAPHEAELNGPVADLTAPAPGVRYLYRVHCGGPDYRDLHGQLWAADRPDRPGGAWGSTSWAMAFPGLPAELGSERTVSDPIGGTHDDPLFQSFRYGREQLQYRFTVPPGDYQLEPYFLEPWYGRGGGVDCTGWRLFDVAVNGATKIRNLDVWKEVGYCHALKRIVTARARGGQLVVSFPRVASYQAVICAIAVAALPPAPQLAASAP
jgi:beta-galactosidase